MAANIGLGRENYLGHKNVYVQLMMQEKIT